MHFIPNYEILNVISPICSVTFFLLFSVDDYRRSWFSFFVNFSRMDLDCSLNLDVKCNPSLLFVDIAVTEDQCNEFQPQALEQTIRGLGRQCQWDWHLEDLKNLRLWETRTTPFVLESKHPKDSSCRWLTFSPSIHNHKSANHYIWSGLRQATMINL